MPPVDPVSLVDNTVAKGRIVIFSKTTCPFCKKVKELFKHLNEHFEAVELDKLEGGNGPAVREALANKTSKNTVPQVFINGQFVGGCDDILAAFESGQLRDLLKTHNNNYDLIVIGGGSGGLSASKEAATSFGKKVALFDFVDPSPRGTTWGLGGTCVNVGCIPKKLMHQAALLGEAMRDSHSFGWRPKHPETNESTVRDSVVHNWNAMVEKIQSHIKMANFNYRVNLRQKKVNYINAKARFIDTHTIEATDKKGNVTTYTSDKFLIATGERPRYPPDCPGAVEYGISSDDLFSLPYNPGKTVVIGASYVALECAGFLRGIGNEVDLLVRSIFLRGFDQDIAEKIGHNLAEEGITIHRPSIPVKVEQLEDGTPGTLRVTFRRTDTGNEATIDCNTVLFAIGRDPCTSEIGLEKVGVKVNPKNGKILVNEREETNVPNIFAVGDILQDRLELTPVAIEAGKLLIRRLFGGQTRLCDYLFVPTTVFTPIEYGAVGYSEEKARKLFGDENIDVYHQGFRPYEWSLTPRSVNACWAKVVVDISEKETKEIEKVIGFHYLGPNAGEVTQFAALAVKLGTTKEDFDHLIGIHPTSAETFNSLTISKSSGQDPSQMKSCCG